MGNEVNMLEKEVLSKKRKRNRIKIKTLKDFSNALEKEGCKINIQNPEVFIQELSKNLKINIILCKEIYKTLQGEDNTYKVDDVENFISYIENIMLFDEACKNLHAKISEIKKLIIHRVEYDREPRVQEDVTELLQIVEKISKEVSFEISREDYLRLESLNEKINKEYLYSKDVELLKKMVIKDNNVTETYNEDSKVKTLIIDMPNGIDFSYVKPEKGSVEYYDFLCNSLSRIGRLVNNLDKYIVDVGNGGFEINQSDVLQDSINVAMAVYRGKEFKAISGKSNIEDYCCTLKEEEAVFESSKVNKLGKLGIGYKRVNDSEKKILERIHREIEEHILEDSGELILYSQWKPCPSCYYVIHQFCERYPKIKFQVRYAKEYGESF